MKISEIYNQRQITDRKAKIGFGKHANEIVQDVLDTNPEYFLWLDENTDIEIASDILTEAEENSGEERTPFSTFWDDHKW